MKKQLVSLATAMLLLIMIPSHAKGATGDSTASVSINTESVEVTALINRVNEINAMDKSSLSATERHALRKELRSAKKYVNAHSHGGAVYVSGGVIILIIVLIILL